jgi:ABC-type transport system involved in multi-copper enzyme maturation permease subunit
MNVFFRDLVRTTRRNRGVLLRVLYALALLLVLGTRYSHRFPGALTPERWFDSPATAGRATEAFAMDFVSACLLVQFAAAAALTPAVAAGAIAEERGRGTFDLLLAADLSVPSIVLGKFAARWLAVAALLLTGVPVIALAQLWGGVSWQQIVFGTGVVLLTTLSFAALGILCSVRALSVRTAVIGAYLAIAGLGICAAVVPPFRIGDPWLAARRFSDVGLFAGPRPQWTAILFGFAIWHITVCLLALLAAAWLVRPQPLTKAERGLLARLYDRLPAGARLRVVLAPYLLPHAPAPWMPGPRRSPAIRVLPVPRIGDDALFWKEVYFGGPTRVGELTRVAAYGVIIGGLIVALALLLFTALNAITIQRQPFGGDDPVFPDLSVTLLTVIMLATALRSAASVAGERDRRTLDALLMLPHRRQTILRAKWVGGLLCARWLMAVLGVVLALGTLAGAIHPAAVVWTLVVGGIHVAFVASLGLFASVVVSGAGRATVLTLAAVVALWLLPPLAVTTWPGIPRGGGWLAGLFREGLSPPATWRNFLGTGNVRSTAGVEGVFVGLAIYAAAAWLFWRAALTEFRLHTGGEHTSRIFNRSGVICRAPLRVTANRRLPL